jgi:hypothetical protein
MALIRGVAAVTLDNPDADGCLLLSGAGWTWRFAERDGDPTSRTLPTEQVWKYAVPLQEAHNYVTSGLPWWTSGAAYQKDTEVAYGTGNPTPVYRCLAGHTAASENAPLLGADWQAYWSPFGGPTEYIPELHGCGPRGSALKQDMVLANWTQDYGTWYVAQAGGSPPAQYLWWPGAGADSYGQVVSVGTFYPQVALWLYRAGAPDGQVWPTFTVIAFQPATGPYIYALYLPLNAQATDLKYPRLLRAPRDTTLDPAQHTVEEWQSSSLQGNAGLGETQEEYLTLENTDGRLFFRTSGGGDAWTYKPAGGIELGPGTLLLEAYGHAVAFNAQQITFPTTSYATPRTGVAAPFWCNGTRTYYHVGTDPGPYDYSGAAQSNYVQVSPLTSPFLGDPKPLIKFVSDGHHRPLCYAVAQVHPPVFTEGRSDPQALEGTGVTVSVSGRVDDTWRGATCEVVLRVDPDGYVLTGNNKVTVDTGWLVVEGTEATIATGAVERQFTGYMTRQERSRTADDLGKVTVKLHCEDGIASRLLGKKFMWQHAVYGGLSYGTDYYNTDTEDEGTERYGKFAYHTNTKLPAGVVVRHILNRAGVPDALIADGVLNCTGNLALPLAGADQLGNLLFDFQADEEVVSALDKIAGVLGGYFGVGVDGKYGVFSRATYAAGDAVDWTLSDSTLTDADLIYEISAERGYDEFRNYVAAIVGQGASAATSITPVWRAGSHATTSDPDFMGDDWWEMILEADASGAAAAILLAQQRHAALLKRGQVLRWTTPGKPDLWPGHLVSVDAVGLDVTSGTVFRIVQKDWSIEPNSGEYVCNFLGVKESG